MSFPWENLTHRALLTFFSGSTGYSYCEDGKLYKWNGNVPETQKNQTIIGIDRVCFHNPMEKDRDQDLLLCLNTIDIAKQIDNTTDHSQVEFAEPSLTLNATIRCFLQGFPDGPGLNFPYRKEMITIRVRYSDEGMQAFWLSDSARIHETQAGDDNTDSVELRRATGTNTLARALQKLSEGGTAPLALGTLTGGVRTDIGTQHSRLLKGLLNNEPSAGSIASVPADLPRAFNRARLTVSFRQCAFSKQGYPNQPGAFAIEFEAHLATDFPDAKARIRCLGIRYNESDTAAPFATSQNREWYFRQRNSAFSTIAVSQSELAKITPAEWILELACLSHQSVATRLAAWTSSGTAGIRGYAGATGASFLPSLDAPAGSETIFAAVYGVADRVMTPEFGPTRLADPATAVRGECVVQPWSVQFIEQYAADPQRRSRESLAITLPLCETVTKVPMAVLQSLSSMPMADREMARGFVLYSDLPLSARGPESQMVRMGSLELGFGARTVVPSPIVKSAFRLEVLNGSPQLQAAVSFVVTRAFPGGQDDIPQDSFLAPNAVIEELPCRVPAANQPSSSLDQASHNVEWDFYRPRPILINRTRSNDDAALLLKATESSGPLLNRTLRLELNIDPNAKPSSGTQQVVVLDSDPFLVAQVSFPALLQLSGSGSFLIASWDNASGDGSKWQIPVNTSSSFRLTLPPQAVGEEMIKNRGYNQLPLDFRLGPPATLAMKTGLTAAQGAATTNYAEVPWNLRRVLGYAGQPLPGVSVDRLDYELVYGLSCDVSQPYVRLAEVFALMGAVPGRIPQYPVATEAQAADQVTDWGKWRQEWAMGYQRYQSRLAILEPSDQHVSGSLTLKHGMSCVVRYKITDDTVKACSEPLTNRGFTFPPDLAVPAPDILPPADLEDPITPAPLPRTDQSFLRGGVTWGFESRNIFCATLRNEFSVKDTASASDLDLTALGGFGHQQASFDEGRTSIFADVAMGRTYYYKIERLGRICTLWNKAKHVIVYERSVVPSRQFYLEQTADGKPTPDYGVPILRKVEEYVEVLEEERRFPDDHLLTNTAAAVEASPDQRCGCLAACVFPKSTKIHVSGSWGSDVNSTKADGTKIPIGWKIPLWKRGAHPADVYPFPKASLSLFSQFDNPAGGSSSKESPCDIGNPENLYFYTDTRPGTGSDTDKWEALIGLDTVDAPAPKVPREKKETANPTIPAIGDVAVPAGFSPCTFTLLSPLRPANIVANRGGNPIAVALDSVTILRGYTGPTVLPPQVTGLHDSWQTVWQTVIASVAPSDWADKAKVKAALITSDVTQAITNFNTQLDGFSGAVNQTWTGGWQNAVKAFNQTSIAKLTNQLKTATSDGQKVAGGIQQVVADVNAGIAQIKAVPGREAERLTQLVQEQFSSFQHAVMDTSATPGVVSSLFQHYLQAANGVIDTWSRAVDQLNALANSTDTSAQDLVARVTQQALTLRDNLQAAWGAAGSYRPLPELADIAAQLETGALKTFRADLNTRMAKLVSSVTFSVNSDAVARLQYIRQQLKDIADNYKVFTPQALKDLNAYASALQSLYALDASVPEAAQTLVSCIDRFRADVTQVIPNGRNWASNTWTDLIAKAAAGKTDDVSKAFHDAFDGDKSAFMLKLQSLTGPLLDEVTTFSNSANAMAKTLSTALNNFKTQADAAWKTIQTDLANALDNASDLRAAVVAFRDSKMADLHSFIDGNLPILRQAQVDINSNTNQLLSLARCFGAAPAVDGLSFLPGKVGYYLAGAALNQVDLSPVTSTLQQAGNMVNQAVNDALSVMKLQVPAISLGDRLVPPDLSNFKLSDIFPRFSGIDLSRLFEGINLNENGDKIRVRHGLDPQSRSAWVEADIGTHLEDVPIFETGGVSLRLAMADFAGQVRIDTGPQGTHQLASGGVLGDWRLLVMGQEVVTLSGTQLLFDNTGKLRFVIKPENVRLPGALNFVTEYLASFGGSGSGLSIKLDRTMLYALLDLPIPDMQGLTSGFSNLSLVCRFGVGIDGSNFKLDVDFGLSSPDKPFNVAVFVLGGAGYILASTSFVPELQKPPVCSVEFGIMASASLAIALGPISGGVYVFLGIRASFATGGPGLNLAAVLLIRGQVNIAGIITASVCLELSVSDDSGHLTGRGHFSISITICWCFTLNISTDVSYTLGSGGSQPANNVASLQNGALLADGRNVFNSRRVLGKPFQGNTAAGAPAPGAGADDLGDLVHDYVTMTRGK